MVSKRWMLVAISVVALAAAPTWGETATAPPPDLSCATLEGADAVLARGVIVLAGEMHGTTESPAFVSDLVCNALERGLPVTVALEVYQEEEARIAAYLASEGDAEDRAALLTGPFWDGEFQDGRRSEAELALLDAVRRERQDGLPVKVVLIDRLEQTPSNVRDAFMASRLAAAASASPDDFVVALTGNLHSRTRKGTPWDADYEPMGLVLEERLPERRVVALDVAHTGGTAWFCNAPQPDSCKAQKVGATPAPGTAGRIVLDDTLAENGYVGYYAVGALTASPPAVDELPTAPPATSSEVTEHPADAAPPG